MLRILCDGKGVSGGGRASVVLFPFASFPSRFPATSSLAYFLCFAPLFFPHSDSTAQLVATFAKFAHAQTGDFVFTNLDDGGE